MREIILRYRLHGVPQHANRHAGNSMISPPSHFTTFTLLDPVVTKQKLILTQSLKAMKGRLRGKISSRSPTGVFFLLSNVEVWVKYFLKSVCWMSEVERQTRVGLYYNNGGQKKCYTQVNDRCSSCLCLTGLIILINPSLFL